MKGILRVNTEGGGCAFDYLFQEYLRRDVKCEKIDLNQPNRYAGRNLARPPVSTLIAIRDRIKVPTSAHQRKSASCSD